MTSDRGCVQDREGLQVQRANDLQGRGTVMGVVQREPEKRNRMRKRHDLIPVACLARSDCH